MQILSIINNEFNLFTLLYIFYEKKILSCDSILNKDYVHKTGQIRLEELLHNNKIFRLCDTPKKEYDYVFVSSHMTAYIYQILESIHYHQLILIEDGTYDYMTEVENNNYTRDAIKYVFHTNLVKVSACKKLKQIKVDKTVDLSLVFKNELDLIYEIKKMNVSALLFTSPLKEDFGIDIENRVATYFDTLYTKQKILIKQHPRDIKTYCFNSCDSQKISTSVFGQLLINEVECPQYFEFPSTTILSAANINTIKLFKFDEDNKKYQDSFEMCNILGIEPIFL